MGGVRSGVPAGAQGRHGVRRQRRRRQEGGDHGRPRRDGRRRVPRFGCSTSRPSSGSWWARRRSSPASSSSSRPPPEFSWRPVRVDGACRRPSVWRAGRARQRKTRRRSVWCPGGARPHTCRRPSVWQPDRDGPRNGQRRSTRRPCRRRGPVPPVHRVRVLLLRRHPPAAGFGPTATVASVVWIRPSRPPVGRERGAGDKAGHMWDLPVIGRGTIEGVKTVRNDCQQLNGH